MKRHVDLLIKFFLIPRLHSKIRIEFHCAKYWLFFKYRSLVEKKYLFSPSVISPNVGLVRTDRFIKKYQKNNSLPVTLGETQLLDLLLDNCGTINDVKYPSQILLKKIITQAPESIKLLDIQPEELSIIAVDKYPSCLEYIKFPTTKILLTAFKKSPSTVRLFKTQTIDDCLLAVNCAFEIKHNIAIGRIRKFLYEDELNVFDHIKIVKSSSLEECYHKLLLKQSIINGL